MEKYIGVKIVEAETATYGGYLSLGNGPVNKDVAPAEEGYTVVYPDGYVSWCPKAQFEEANRPMTGMTFGHAIEASRKGESFRLPSWHEDVFISLQSPDENSKMTAPYLYVTSRYGCVPWIPTMIEILSCDWEVVG